jgi:hypothetical protein
MFILPLHVLVLFADGEGGCGCGAVKKGGGFGAPMDLSADLQAVIGKKGPLPRPAVVKEIWAYVKKHKVGLLLA